MYCIRFRLALQVELIFSHFSYVCSSQRQSYNFTYYVISFVTYYTRLLLAIQAAPIFSSPFCMFFYYSRFVFAPALGNVM